MTYNIGNLRRLAETLIETAERDGNEAEHQLGIGLVNLARDEGLAEEQIIDALGTRRFDFRVYDEADDGEFGTWCKVDLLEDGKVVHTESFSASSEFPPEQTSAYYSGDSNHAVTQALSYANAWVEAEERRVEAERLGVHPLEIAFAPHGPAWQAEQADRDDIPF